ncbi:hypothetical protein DMC63_01500 [Streptomyces sp. WAC 05977]|nr:hypothetical protein DMC63_01500 [Streptomyces sp. WAC 05977]
MSTETISLPRLLPGEAALRVADQCTGDPDKFFVRAGNDFLASVERGEHDSECEYLRGARYYLCNCSKREREAKGFTTPPGDLEWISPICPRCDEHVDHDGDNWTCPRCCAYWEEDGTGAQFYDDHGDLAAELAAITAAPKRRKIIDVHLPEPDGEVIV